MLYSFSGRSLASLVVIVKQQFTQLSSHHIPILILSRATNLLHFDHYMFTHQHFTSSSRELYSCGAKYTFPVRMHEMNTITNTSEIQPQDLDKTRQGTEVTSPTKPNDGKEQNKHRPPVSDIESTSSLKFNSSQSCPNSHNLCQSSNQSLWSTSSSQRNPAADIFQTLGYQSINGKTNKTVVCIEGNIGCGKTTLLNYFENFQNCEVLPEPVEKWRNCDGYNGLALMYEDPKRWGMALQTYIQLTMVQAHKQPQVKDVRLMERSIFSAKYCFTDNLRDSGNMPDFEHTILSKWFDWIIKTQDIKVDLFVYLRSDPVLLRQRVLKRCRKEEEGISLELLTSLHNKYEDWLIHKKHPCTADVLVIDANHSIEEMQDCYEAYKNKILVRQVK